MKLNGYFVRIGESEEAHISFAEYSEMDAEEFTGVFVDMMDQDTTYLEDAEVKDNVRVPVAYLTCGRVWIGEVGAFFLKDKKHEGYAFVREEDFLKMMD